MVKGTRIKAASNPAQEPNFYMLPNVDSNERNKESMQSAAVSVASVSASIFQQARDTSIETPWYPNVPVHFIQPPAEVAVQKQENDRLGCFLPAVTNTDDTIASNIGEAVLGDESIDADMILDFCADWAPSSMVGPDPDMPPIVAFEQV